MDLVGNDGVIVANGKVFLNSLGSAGQTPLHKNVEPRMLRNAFRTVDKGKTIDSAILLVQVGSIPVVLAIGTCSSCVLGLIQGMDGTNVGYWLSVH